MTVCQISVGKKKKKKKKKKQQKKNKTKTKTNKQKNKQKKKKKTTKKKTASLLIFIQVEKINSKGGKIKELAHRKKKEKAKKEGLTMRLPILSYNQAELCGQIVFKR